MDIDPTGCSTWKELSSPNVGLSKAEAGALDSAGLDMAGCSYLVAIRMLVCDSLKELKKVRAQYQKISH